MLTLTLIASAFMGAVVYPQEIDTPLHNPHKGWVYIDHAIPGKIDAGRSVAQCDDGTAFEWYQHVAVLSTWALIEQTPDHYDWALMDQAVDYWRGQGKQIHLRFSTEDFNIIPGCPRWIFEAGVPEYRRDHRRYPDYTHPYYRERLAKFLHVLADKYADDPGIETVNLQGYGNWGEWHSGYNYATVEERVTALRGIIDMWREAFAGRKFLNLSVTFEWRTIANTGTAVLPPGTSINEDFPPSYQDYRYRSAFDYALGMPDITVARHGVGGAVKMKYDGRLIANFFQHWRKPLFMEFFGNLSDYTGYSIVGFPTTREGDDHVENAVDELLSHHPNHASPLGWGSMGAAADFYNSYRDLMLEGHKRMGYRFVLIRAEFPDQAAPGAEFVLRHSWENRALGRCYVRYPLKIYLMQGDKVAWSAVDKHFDQRNMVAGETYDLASRFRLPESLPSGEYGLHVAMVDGAGAPALRLAIAGDDGRKRYPLGRVVIGAQAARTPFVPQVEPVRQGARWVAEHATEPDRTYLVSFTYTVTRSPTHDLDTDNPGCFRFYGEGSRGDRQDEVRWYDKAGQPPSPKTVLVRTGKDAPCTLVWEAVGGGALTVCDVRMEALPEDRVRRLNLWSEDVWRDGRVRNLEGRRALARKDRSEVVLPDDWCDMVRTRPDRFPLRPDTVYTVWFDWAATPKLFQGDYFYLSLRDGQENETAQFRWTQRHTANPVRHAYTFRTEDIPDSQLIWGMKNGGTATLLNVSVVRR